jgi:hypothetical protein
LQIPQPNNARLADPVYTEVFEANDSDAASSMPVEGPTSQAINRQYQHCVPPIQCSTVIDLPLYIQKLPITLRPEDLDHLAAKGAFTLPAKHFLIVCLCRYVEFVHPVLPFLKLNETLMAIDDERGMSGKVSLLLFFAIIYAALPFTENKHVRTVGYSTKLEARTAIYINAKVRFNGADMPRR